MKVLTADEVAVKTKTTKNWVTEHCHSRCPVDQRLPFFKLGKHLRFSEAAIDSYLERLAGQPSSTQRELKVVRR